MNDKNDDQFATILGSIVFLVIGGLTVCSIALAYQDGYKAGIKDSPAQVNVAGDQIITNTNSNLSPFSGNANEALKGGSYGLLHPKLLKGNQQVVSAGTGGGWTWGNDRQPQRPVDSLKFELNGNVARSVNNLAGNFGRGLKTITNFFGGKK